MKPQKTVTNCEFCDKQLEVCTPPPEAHYENAGITINEGMILLPRRVHRGGASRATSIAGHYCGPECLAAQIGKVLNRPTAPVA